jgi:hypothetical protein
MVNLVATLYQSFFIFVLRYTHKTEIAIRLTARKDELIFKLKFNQMDTKKINDIEVHDFDVVSRDFDAVIKRLDIENAKELLKREGYYVDNLWQTCDVTLNYDCTEEEAQDVLNKSLTNDATYEQIWMSIGYVAESMNLKRRD